VHPCDSLPASGVQLQQVTLQHPQAATLSAACEAIGVAHHVAVTAGDMPQLTAQLTTPQGPVTLSSFIPQKAAA